MRLFVHEVRTEQMLFWRNREAAFFTFFLPIIFFLVFGSIYGNTLMSHHQGRSAPFLEARPFIFSCSDCSALAFSA